jgi:hypothetical protein
MRCVNDGHKRSAQERAVCGGGEVNKNNVGARKGSDLHNAESVL